MHSCRVEVATSSPISGTAVNANVAACTAHVEIPVRVETAPAPAIQRPAVSACGGVIRVVVSSARTELAALAVVRGSAVGAGIFWRRIENTHGKYAIQ